jgi:hypothetical protein
MRTFVALSITALLLGPLAACSDEDEHEHEHDGGHVHADGGHDVDEEGCEHLAQGPFKDVTAGADSASAAEIKADHSAYRVTLAAGAAGFVKYAADAKGDHVLFVDADLALEVQDDQNMALTLEESVKSVTACTVVKGKHTFELPAVGTYFFRLGPPSAAGKVTVVLEEASHGD